MPSPFAITTATNAVSLDAQRRSEASFTVSNTSGSPIRGRAQLTPEAPASAAWLTLTEEAEQDFSTGSTQQYTVKIAVPADTPAGTYSFRLNMVGVENPDELFTQGPSITFQVPEPEPKKPFPWWIVIVAVGALALCCALGVGGYFVAQNLQPTPTPTSTPAPTGTPPPTSTPTPIPTQTPIPEPLENTNWKLDSLAGEAPLAETTITLRLVDGKVGGSSGCNQYGGEYKVDEDTLSFGNIISTLIACLTPDGVMAQEQKYLKLLKSASRYQIVAQRLEIFDENDQSILEFVAQ
jgi:heat shock protein HslJ